MISIHAPAKGATNDDGIPLFGWKISIHAPAKGATLEGWAREGLTDISIHAPAKGATITTNTPNLSKLFQSTLPRRERLVPVEVLAPHDKFQSTLPRRERRFREYIKVRDTDISIHAPAKGATI